MNNDANMDDWKNWKVGDIVRIIDSENTTYPLKEYTVSYVEDADYRGNLLVEIDGYFWPERKSLEWMYRPSEGSVSLSQAPDVSQPSLVDAPLLVVVEPQEQLDNRLATPFEKWCSDNGYKTTDYFQVFPEEGRTYAHASGTIVKLKKDDDTGCPAFSDGINHFYYTSRELVHYGNSIEEGKPIPLGSGSCNLIGNEPTNEHNSSSLTNSQWSGSHYDFYHVLTSDEMGDKRVKVDPYFVSNQWKLGSKDESGVLFHILKTLARFGDKNPREREVVAIYKQIKRLAELEGIDLDD